MIDWWIYKHQKYLKHVIIICVQYVQFFCVYIYSQKNTAGNPTRHMTRKGEISSHDIYFIALRKVPYFNTLFFLASIHLSNSS